MGHGAQPTLNGPRLFAVGSPRSADQRRTRSNKGSSIDSTTPIARRSGPSAAGRYGALATQLGIAATILAAVATLTALPDNLSNWVTAITAFTAALVSGIGTTINPQERAKAHQGRAVEWRELHNKARRLSRQREMEGSQTGDEWRIERDLERLEFQRDNLRRKAAGLEALPEPAIAAEP